LDDRANFLKARLKSWKKPVSLDVDGGVQVEKAAEVEAIESSLDVDGGAEVETIESWEAFFKIPGNDPLHTLLIL